MKYTIENVKTKRIKIVKVKNDVLNYSLEKIYHIMDKYGCGFKHNLPEITFIAVFNKEGWIVHKLPFNKRDPVLRYVRFGLERDLKLNTEALYGNGCPDFLLVNYNKKLFRFVEVKHSEKKLNKNQLNWIKKFGYNLYVVRLAPLHDGYQKFKKKEIIKRNKMV